MRILVFPPFYPPHIGGVETFAWELNNRLAENDHRVTVFAPEFVKTANTSSVEPVHQTEKVKVLYYPAIEIISNYPLPKFWSLVFWRSLKSLSALRNDVVLSHTRFFIASFFALIYAKVKRAPLLHIEHGSSLVQSDKALISLVAGLYDYSIGSIVIRSADCVIAISSGVNRFIKSKWGVESGIIYRGFDPILIDEITESAHYQKKSGILRILYVGRLISGKGLTTLFESLKKIQREDWELYLIGDGPERNILERSASYFQLDRITFLGQKSWTETIAILKTADIFVSPSQSEGLPTTVAEASLCGKAVIATDVGGTRELFPPENYDLLVPANNTRLLSEKISMLIKNRERINSSGIAAKKFITAHFSWDQSMKKFLGILDTLHKRHE